MGVDVNQGASQIAQLLQPEQPSDSAPEAEVIDEVIESSEETEASQPETEEADATNETEEQPETPEEPQQETQSDTEAKYKVKVGGEEQEVSLEDLRKGYMMESDYRKKTSEVARQREEAEKKVSELSNYVKDAELMLKLDEEDLNSPDNLDLKEYDPTAFYEKREKIEAKRKRLDELKSEAKKVEAEKAQETIAREKELMLQALPSWLDDNTLNSEVGMINEYWKEIGLNQEDLSRFTDHRLVLMSRDAALYRKLKSAKPETKKVTPKPKSAAPGASKPGDQSERDKTLRSRAAKTGNVRDAAAAIKQLMR